MPLDDLRALAQLAQQGDLEAMAALLTFVAAVPVQVCRQGEILQVKLQSGPASQAVVDQVRRTLMYLGQPGDNPIELIVLPLGQGTEARSERLTADALVPETLPRLSDLECLEAGVAACDLAVATEALALIPEPEKLDLAQLIRRPEAVVLLTWIVLLLLWQLAVSLLAEAPPTMEDAPET